MGGKINTEDARVEQVTIQANTQRHKLARYAGEEWQILLAYLRGDETVFGGIDG